MPFSHKPLKRLFSLIAMDRHDIYAIYFYAILGGLLQLTVPVGVQAIIGFVLGASMVTSIYVLIALVVLGVLLVGIFQINQMKIIEKIQQKIFARNAFEFAEVIPNLDMQKADKTYLPEVVNRFFDTMNVQKGISKLLLDIPTAMIQILFGLILLSLYHIIFIAFGLVLILILYLILKLTSRKGLETSYAESSYKYAVVGWLEEMGRVLKSFKFTQGTHLNLKKTDENVLGYIKSRTAHFRVLLVQYRALVVFKVLITATMLIVGTILLLSQQLNIGEFIAAEIVILTIISAVEKLISSLESIYDVITGLEKLATVNEQEQEKSGGLLLENTTTGMAIKFSDFNFSYEAGFNVLTNINLTIPANSKVCLMGKENSGRTSLLKVMSGSYRQFEGALLINNIPIGNYSLQSIRSKTGFLMFQQDIFVGTVLENISLGHNSITGQTISAIAEKLGIENFIYSLPNGYETIVDPTGNRLPQSIIRKILLLRSMCNNPSLLLLEEPWDGFTADVHEKIKQCILHHNATAVVISNDEQFAASCDFIVNMENGTITNIKAN